MLWTEWDGDWEIARFLFGNAVPNQPAALFAERLEWHENKSNTPVEQRPAGGTLS